MELSDYDESKSRIKPALFQWKTPLQIEGLRLRPRWKDGNILEKIDFQLHGNSILIALFLAFPRCKDPRMICSNSFLQIEFVLLSFFTPEKLVEQWKLPARSWKGNSVFFVVKNLSRFHFFFEFPKKLKFSPIFLRNIEF